MNDTYWLGPYQERNVVFGAALPGAERETHLPCLLLSSDIGVTHGCEIHGQPEKLGRPRLEFRGDLIVGTPAHNRIDVVLWPEIDASLRNAGVRHYRSFRHGLTLFGDFEPDDLDRTIAILKDDPVNRRWSEHMDDIMRIDIGPQAGFPFLLLKQWSLD
jgi:L-rhamnose mutarotase